ncbi:MULTISPECIES: hypothetical protein [unclassified Sphingobium]|uniref:hypothetical protein n=1 Tax=unclassified Sphingobium TaxID=2611147 RepID=UPI00083DF2E0|nr:MULTISPECIES: hypothetical protein [unclassified Sphingobium]AOF94792.1 hypothetical protein BSY17_3245 [Sphingobium sp. RAC03]WCP15801.1 hypothetical protein sphantq_04289 [Sphingobium sp. AntQ-1]
MADPVRASSNDDDDAAFAEGAITLWSNLLALMGTHLLEAGTPRQEVLDMLTMLHETNEETIRSPRARAIAGRHLMSVYRVLGEA